MKIKEKKWIRFRIFFVSFFLMCGFAAIVARAYQLQVLEKDQLRAIAKAGYTGTIKLPPKRGTIYDRKGHELALSVEVASVYAHPKKVKEKIKTAKKLSKILGEKRYPILKRLSSKRSFVWIKRKVEPAKAEKIKKLGLPGVGITKESRRYYPCREIAAHVIGFAGADNQGLEGLEKKYDTLLRGPTYEFVQMQDALGRPFFVKWRLSNHDQLHQLVLTIDKDIQYKAQQALKAAVIKFRAKAGNCVVMDPYTGEILAMAVIPEFNPNIFTKYSPAIWRNRAVTDCFEPGSTIKAFLVAACLQEKVVTPYSTFNCEHGKYRILDKVVHDTHKYGVLTVSDIVAYSSNIGAIKMGRLLGYGRFYQYLKKFGFGHKTGVNLLGERNGFIRPPEKAKPIDQAVIFFGQGMTTTTIQLARAMAAIANGGYLMRPYIIKKILDKSGRTVKMFRPVRVRKVISGETSAQVVTILQRVVEKKGTGPQAAIAGYRVAGKTGTAQKVDPVTRKYSNKKYMASFVGFAPARHPRFVIAVVIDEPKGIPYGGVVAGPVFRELGLWTLNYLRVNPEVRVAESEAFCKPSISSNGTRCGISGKPSLAPEAFAKAGVVPDFRGLSMRDVLTKANSMGLKVIVQGTGFAYKQKPAPGGSLAKVKVLKVQFRPPT